MLINLYHKLKKKKMYFILPHSWTGNCFIKTMIYVQLHGNRGGEESDGGYMLSSCFLHWYLLHLEKSNPVSLRKLFTESVVVGILIFEPSVGCYVFLYLALSSIQVKVLDSGLDTAELGEQFVSIIAMLWS